jgi:hypothetical protein
MADGDAAAPTRAFQASVVFYDPPPKNTPASAVANTNLRTLTVAVQASASTKLTPIAYTPASTPTTPTTIPTSPNVYLQIWEVEKFETAAEQRAHDSQKSALQSQYQQQDTGNPPPTPANHLLVEIPGFIQEIAPAKSGDQPTYEFHLLGTPTNAQGSANICGYFWLVLKDSGGHLWPAGADTTTNGDNITRPFTVLIYGDCEDEVDLSCSLETQSGQTSHGDSGWAEMSLFHMTNLTHIILGQMEEGGLSIALWVKITNGDANDASFPGFAKIASDRLHGLTVDDYNQLKLGHTGNGFSQQSDIFPKAKRILDAVAASPILHITNPVIYRFMICTHGWPDGPGGIRTGDSGNDQVLGTDIATFFAPFIPLFHPSVIFTLFACMTGQSSTTDRPNGTVRKQTNHYQGWCFPPRVGNQLGKGSFAGTLFEFLRDQLKTSDGSGPGPVVWSHVTLGPSINNGTMRVFAKRYDKSATQDQYPTEGARDLYWIKDGAPPPWLADQDAALPDSFVDKLDALNLRLKQLDLATMYIDTDIETCRPGDALQRFLKQVPDSLFPSPSASAPQKTASADDANSGGTGDPAAVASNDPAAAQGGAGTGTTDPSGASTDPSESPSA